MFDQLLPTASRWIREDGLNVLAGLCALVLFRMLADVDPAMAPSEAVFTSPQKSVATSTP